MRRGQRGSSSRVSTVQIRRIPIYGESEFWIPNRVIRASLRITNERGGLPNLNSGSYRPNLPFRVPLSERLPNTSFRNPDTWLSQQKTEALNQILILQEEETGLHNELEDSLLQKKKNAAQSKLLQSDVDQLEEEAENATDSTRAELKRLAAEQKSDLEKVSIGPESESCYPSWNGRSESVGLDELLLYKCVH